MNDIPTRPVPEGMTLNAYGGYTPTKAIKPQHLLEDQMVNLLLVKALGVSQTIARFREHAFEEVDEFLGMLADKYGAPRGGQKGNTTLQSFDGLRKVQIATGDFLTFGGELQAAKSLIDSCLERWSSGANDNLRAIVNDAFNVGKEGKLQVDRILALRRVEIDDAEWARAMVAISEAVRVTHSRRYVRFYSRRSHDAKWQQISLDLSRADAGEE